MGGAPRSNAGSHSVAENCGVGPHPCRAVWRGGTRDGFREINQAPPDRRRETQDSRSGFEGPWGRAEALWRRLSSDGGVLLFPGIERRLGIADLLASCVTDERAPASTTEPSPLISHQLTIRRDNIDLDTYGEIDHHIF